MPGRPGALRVRAAFQPGESALTSWVFLRLLALVYLAAFVSLATQIEGLVGSDGILPLGDYLDAARQALGNEAYWEIPTLFWLNASDLALKGACLAGVAAALAVLSGVLVRTGLAACYVLYLSLIYAGQIFMTFQWDLFLLESGFLAIFLTFGSPIVVWLYRFLVFRFMLMGGVVKLASGDPAWRSLTALNYHFETQPLPSPLAWYAHQLPESVLQALTTLVFAIELIVPFFVFLPRKFRLFAAAGFLVLQGSIILTGSYNFFNILTIILCIFLLDDRDLRPLLGERLSRWMEEQAKPSSQPANVCAGVLAAVVLAACASMLWLTNTHRHPIQPFYALVRWTSALGIVNGYGPFAVMTQQRREIVVEGSNDGESWLAYEFDYKPGDPARPLSWNIPHQPRLDWQMWFAALGDEGRNAWLPRFMAKLKEGSKPVLALLAGNPFPDRPPRYIRASLYLYRFSTPDERSTSGQVWQRELLGVYRIAD